MWNTASMSEQKSALELILPCAFCILVCFLPERITGVLLKGSGQLFSEEKITNGKDSVLDVKTLCCLMRTPSHLGRYHIYRTLELGFCR